MRLSNLSGIRTRIAINWKSNQGWKKVMRIRITLSVHMNDYEPEPVGTWKCPSCAPRYRYLRKVKGPGAAIRCVRTACQAAQEEIRFFVMLYRYVIVKHVRKDHLEELPVPNRIKTYLNTPFYYSEQVKFLRWNELSRIGLGGAKIFLDSGSKASEPQ